MYRREFKSNSLYVCNFTPYEYASYLKYFKPNFVELVD